MSLFGMKIHVAALEKHLPIEGVMVPFADYLASQGLLVPAFLTKGGL